ncbi:histidinol-phosphate transaminase [Aminipila sp.]|jgi:histidinol-phosphate aminotransferase|uniref:histidinol-phosphate transaminase n=1 Tax=Aminipila sp. TaxID=2060095 RepID=UPI001DABE997|nr:histidinol-phosphate transaminase [Aminipila sp.]MBE6034606.1 histidinol-phosphate transaminase [Clostridiales bacterium]
MSKFLNEKYQRLKTYTPGEQPQDMKYIKLNTNESPYPPAPSVLSSINGEEIKNLRLYSDPQCKSLREKIALLYGVSAQQVYLSNGSDDILNFAFMAFSGNSIQAAFPDISYGFYKVFAELHGISYTEIPLSGDFSINYRDYCHINQFIVIANPNAPTGLTLTVSQIEEIVRTNPSHVVVIDEAYVDFGAESCYPLIHRYENLLVVQTFSKSRSMAGGRLGFALGSQALIEDLEKLKYATNPYNVNRMTLIAGAATIEANDYYMDKCKEIACTRNYTQEALKKMGFDVLPSKANFIFAKSPHLSGKVIYDALKEKGILIRHFPSPRISDYNRITIGTRNQMEILLHQLKIIINERQSNENK